MLQGSTTGYPGNFSEAFDLFFEHVKGVIAEVFDDFLGRLRPNTFDKP